MNRPTMRIIKTAVFLGLILLSGCSTLAPREYSTKESLAYYCVPGSAIRRAASPGVNYPGWMMWDGGSCKYR